MPDCRNERRRDERLLVSLPVALVRGKRRVPLVTEDVSFRGLFLCADKPPAVHQLIQLEVALPALERILPLHARVVRVRSAGGNGENGGDGGDGGDGLRAPGVGVELHALAGAAKSAWEEFVRGLLPKGRPSSAAVPVAGTFERRRTELRFLLESVGDLEALVATQLAHEVAFVPTELALPVGYGFRVTLVHPVTAATHGLHCVVTWREAESGAAGVGMELQRTDEAETAALRDFLGDEPPMLSATLHDVDQAQLEQWEDEEPTNVKPLPRKPCK